MALRTLFFVDDIMERYRCGSKDTARRYMRQMGAKGCPLFVTEEMITAWEDSKREKEEEAPIPQKRRRRRPLPKEMVIPGRKVG